MSASKIIALNPMVAEWTAEIIGEKEALKRLIASSDYSNYPTYLNGVPTIGSYRNIQIEKILSLNPDLVIGSSEYNRHDQLERLKKLKLNVEILPKEKFNDMKEWIGKLGNALGEQKKADLSIRRWEDNLARIKMKSASKKAKANKAFFMIQHEPLITVGKNSFINDVFRLAGKINVFEELDQSYPRISKEAVFSKKPDEIYYFEMVKEQNELSRIQAAWPGSKIRVLSGDDFSRCSMRLLKAVEEMVANE